MQDLGGFQDDHVQEDFQDRETASGQHVPACRCPPVRVVDSQGHVPNGTDAKATDCDERAPFDDSLVSHNDTEAA